jgi:putative transposase
MGMPWKSIALTGVRDRFVRLALKAAQPFQQLCQLFHISRKTGYKWKARFLAEGRGGLKDRSRRPRRHPHQMTQDWKARLRKMRRRHRCWGARKIRARLKRQHGAHRLPAVRTLGRWLQRLKLSRPRRRSRPGGPVVPRSGLTRGRFSNHVWTVDFKGWFRTRDGVRVEPLTVRDLFSRYVLAVHLLPDQRWGPVQAVFLRLFRRYGVPKVIRVDNGKPFGSGGPAGLTRLSAWWTALGIRVEFIRPGHPEQNGSHEQMHRVLKAETTVPVSSTLRAQQRRLKRWRRIYNQERPHEGLGERTPAECYRPAGAVGERGEVRVEAWDYPCGWAARGVRSNGEIRWQGRLRFIGEAFVGRKVGMKPGRRGRWRVYFRDVLLGELRATDAGGLRVAIYERKPTPDKR